MIASKSPDQDSAGGLEARPDDTTEASVTFSGRGAGTYEIIGE